MEASSDGMIAERNHQFLEPLDAFGHVSHGRARSYTLAELQRIVYQRNSGSIINDGTTFR
jgi:hypothetical protein